MLVHFGPDAAESDQRGTPYERWETRSADDGCAMVDYCYCYCYCYCCCCCYYYCYYSPKRTICLVRSAVSWAGGLVAFVAGELVQQMLLANTSGLGISAIFDKVYPCSVDAHINQKLVVDH